MTRHSIQLKNRLVEIELEPNSADGLIRVFLPGIQYSVYNPKNEMFVASPHSEKELGQLFEGTEFQELKTKLKQFSANLKK
jgi:hypothetical protein